MGFDPVLAQMGYVPQGARPKTIIDNGEPGYYQTSHLENLSRAIDKYKFQQEESQQKRMTEMQNKMTLFKTMRENGYSSPAATRIVEKNFGKVSDDIPGQTEAEQKLKLEIDKIRADKFKAEQEAKLQQRKSYLEDKKFKNDMDNDAITRDKNLAEINKINYQMAHPEQKASYIIKKNKDTEKFYTTVENNNVKRVQVNAAVESAKRIASGIYGKVGRNFLKTFGSNSEAMADFQKIKTVLTDATLLNTMKTKGAISDQEMNLFKEATANDDLVGLSRLMPVFNKFINQLNADELASVKSYRQNYGEDPYGFEGSSSNINDTNLYQGNNPELNTINSSNQQIPSFNSEQEAEQAGLPTGTIIMINGRRARID